MDRTILIRLELYYIIIAVITKNTHGQAGIKCPMNGNSIITLIKLISHNSGWQRDISVEK